MSEIQKKIFQGIAESIIYKFNRNPKAYVDSLDSNKNKKIDEDEFVASSGEISALRYTDDKSVEKLGLTDLERLQILKAQEELLKIPLTKLPEPRSAFTVTDNMDKQKNTFLESLDSHLQPGMIKLIEKHLDKLLTMKHEEVIIIKDIDLNDGYPIVLRKHGEKIYYDTGSDGYYGSLQDNNDYVFNNGKPYSGTIIKIGMFSGSLGFERDGKVAIATVDLGDRKNDSITILKPNEDGIYVFKDVVIGKSYYKEFGVVKGSDGGYTNIEVVQEDGKKVFYTGRAKRLEKDDSAEFTSVRSGGRTAFFVTDKNVIDGKETQETYLAGERLNAQTWTSDPEIMKQAPQPKN